jgi:formylglycine-generating enzyme required for sulfatase activity
MLTALLFLPIGSRCALAVTIDWASVGNAGNAPDTAVMFTDGTTGYGAVDYNFRISKYEITIDQYVEFLNAKDPTGTNELGLDAPALITFDSAAPDGSKYGVRPGGYNNFPVPNMSWFNAVRFTNWLNNGQGDGDTETGAYTLLGGTPIPSNANSITRNPGATVFLPSEDEWYKAAYYDPVTESYFQYPTSSNADPTSTGPTSAPNSINADRQVLGIGAYPVGSYTGTTSPYGIFDMGGNIYEWTDTLVDGENRVLRGGAWPWSAFNAHSTVRVYTGPTSWSKEFGFRVASVPEPSSGIVAALGLAGYGFLCWRRRRSSSVVESSASRRAVNRPEG